LASSKWSKILSWEKKKKSFRKRKGKRKIKGIGERIRREGGNMTRGSYEVSNGGRLDFAAKSREKVCP
jgi:hypothetical protein